MKTLIAIIVILIVGAGAYLLLNPMTPGAGSPTATTTTTGPQSYASVDAGISFTYPSSYRLEERSDSFEGQAITVITLIDKEVVIPDMGEGPPAISVLIIPVSTSTSLETWIKTKSISNFNLSADKKLSSTTLDGKAAFSYTHSGLYESNATAVSHNGKIYLFSVGSIDQNEAIYKDFQNLLSAVQL